jgi:cysteine desulfurase / selenocysteine lyase
MSVLTRTFSPVEIDAIRAQFPILDQSVDGQPLAYLDSAATAQKPQAVIDALAGYYSRDNANVHRGLYDLARRATDAYEGARARIARFVGAADPREIVFVRGSTEALNLVAHAWGATNLRKDDEILLTVLEHHSNIVPWQLVAERTGAHIRYIDIDDEGRLRLDMLDGLLTERTRVVALGHASNALGTVHPIAEISARAAAMGARVVVDGAQGAPHLQIDVAALGCDAYTLSGHKMGAPMGIGALWMRRELLEAMPPWQGGGEMIDTVEDQRSTWAAVPHKFEAGTPNVGGAVAMAAAADWLDTLGRDAIEAREAELIRYGLERLGEVDGLRLFGPSRPHDRLATFSFVLDDVHPHDVATILDAEAIAVRAGHHCAQPLMRRLGVAATTRASCWVYTTEAEIDRLVAGLDRAREMFA